MIIPLTLCRIEHSRALGTVSGRATPHCKATPTGSKVILLLTSELHASLTLDRSHYQRNGMHSVSYYIAYELMIPGKNDL